MRVASSRELWVVPSPQPARAGPWLASPRSCPDVATSGASAPPLAGGCCSIAVGLSASFGAPTATRRALTRPCGAVDLSARRSLRLPTFSSWMASTTRGSSGSMSSRPGRLFSRSSPQSRPSSTDVVMSADGASSSVSRPPHRHPLTRLGGAVDVALQQRHSGAAGGGGRSMGRHEGGSRAWPSSCSA
jgi:hypothetical protein